MAKLRVTLIDEVRSRRLKVDLPDNAGMEKLLPALAEKLGLPTTDPGGQPIAYQLTHEATGRALGGGQTLASFGVRDGDALRLATAREEAPIVPRPAVEVKPVEMVEEEEAVSIWQKVPVWGWVGIVVVVLLAVAALAFLAGRGAKPEPTLTVVAMVTTPAVTEASTRPAPAPTATPAPPTAVPTSTPLPTDTPVPTSTPRPTDTPVPPTDTPVPTATPQPTPTPTPTMDADPTVYDNFNNPAFDREWNTGLWIYGDKCNPANTLVKQKDGILMISRQLDNPCGLATLRPRTWTLDQIGFVEAKLMLDGNIEASEWGDVGIAVSGLVNGDEWWTACYILGKQQEGDARAACDTSDYEGQGLAVQYNSWHTMRLEINPDTAVISYFVDGQQIDAYVHANPEAFKKTQFEVSVYVWSFGGGLVTGYIDDVRVGPVQ